MLLHHALQPDSCCLSVRPTGSAAQRKAGCLRAMEPSDALDMSHRCEETVLHGTSAALTMTLAQEREAKKDTWKPRWFKANPGGPVFDGEHPEDKCPLWEFTGDVFQQPKRPAQPEGAVQPITAATVVLRCGHLGLLRRQWTSTWSAD